MPDQPAPLPERSIARLIEAANLLQRGEAAAARAITLEIVSETPSFADAWHVHAAVLQASGEAVAALDAARRGLAILPDHPALCLMEARLCQSLGDMVRARTQYDKVLSVEPDNIEALASSANILLIGGEVREAAARFRRASALAPNEPNIASKIIEAIDYLHDVDAEAAQAERRRWNDRFAAPLRAAWQPHANRPERERCLRIGYVSAHFNQESPARIFAPIIKAHDGQRFEAVCYSDMLPEAADALTADLKSRVPMWRSMVGVPDAAFCQQIRADGIDILVDLCGHTVPNRLRAFAAKPAPVQVTAWGNAGGTGLAAMDYLLADPVSVPAGERHLFAETVLDLTCVLMVELPDYLPPVAPLPMMRTGHVTFGSFNRPQKLDDDTLAFWAELLQRVPDAHLVIKSSGLNRPDVQQRFFSALTRGGVTPERLRFYGPSNHQAHLAAYGEVDIVLDPLAHGGALTTAEALAMGVPTINLYGTSMMRRQTAAIQGAIGLNAFTAYSREEYVSLAQSWAGRGEELAQLRAGLRQRMVSSPLANPALYAAEVEAQYRTIWRNWCADQGAKP